MLIAVGLCGVSSGSLSMSQNCAQHSGLQQTCSALDTQWNILGATMTPLCSRTGLIGPVPKGRWRLSWTNRCYGWTLGSLIWTELEMPIKWMEASQSSWSKESAPYTMCCEVYVHCGVWHRWDNTAPHCISKADGKCCLLLHVPAAHPRPALRRKVDTWWYRTPSFSMIMQGVTPLLLSQTSCAAGNGRFWNIHRTHPIWVHAIMISSPLRGTQYNTRVELIRAIGRSILNINKDGRADGVRRLSNIWQKVINKGATTLKVPLLKWGSPVNKTVSEI